MSASQQISALQSPPTHLYFFATPVIFRRRNAVFDWDRFSEFNSFYLVGFFDLINSCVQFGSQGLRVFVPSSTLLDGRPGTATEYAMSKAASEVLCRNLPELLPGVRAYIHRLGRIVTDQTSSVVPSTNVDPSEVILPILREMNRG
jgi:NAD(P)-dependent dehydrogenase (short-subunit alcohol dehydrogenase family)